ncbi:MAG: hypothetical protein ABS35_42035 [Kaistia sp. SCN 65-12]|nr:MAG: hypothetical protein ABS35_42035 [Kaistia sp. SCN 65-12]
MYMTDAQLDILKDFIADDLAGGSLPFTVPAQDGTGTWIVQIGREVPTWNRMALGWAVKLDLVILP